MEKILVVDDEESLRDVLSIMLKRTGYTVTSVADGEQALEILNKEIFDLVITDLRMPKIDGMEVLKAAKSAAPETVVLVITAFASAESAVEAMKQGAYDYLTKPFQIDEVQLIIRNALEKRRLTTENMLLKREIASRASFSQLVGQSNVLICGESGTGKELVARAIHYNSARSAMPFVAVNCSAVPETLLESELFGHMKGSFTGAVSNKVGLFEVADGGTIFLDEIGDTPPSIQVKLLRVIQEREFRRVGGHQDVKVDVRIVAATNKDLEKAVADGSFRQDLYYRLDVIPIRLPPLRMRTGDIPLLVDHFLERFSKESGKPVPTLSPDAMRVLLEHEWRGNVRELENLIERVVAFSKGETVTDAEVRGWLHRPVAPEPQRLVPLELTDEGVDLEGLVNRIERDLLLKALERSKWVKKKAARLLRLNTRSFRYRLEKYAIKGGRD
ncbi:MAG: sigma-54 dependent transcriptional regulator [Nitrospira sp.]|nr:sigma-54 dependent transcriptional regulator [Nitrospira sp.]